MVFSRATLFLTALPDNFSFTRRNHESAIAQHVSIELVYFGDTHEFHVALYLASHIAQCFFNARLTCGSERIKIHASAGTRFGACCQCLYDVRAAANAAVANYVDIAANRIGYFRYLIEGRTLTVELTPAVV